MLGLPYPEEYGGSGQPYEVYLQALEEVAPAWMSVGVGVSVHVMTCYAMATFGDPDQQRAWLPGMLGGRQLGAYALSEPQAGSDIGSISTRAKTRRRGLLADRHQGLGHPRLQGRLLHHLRPDGRAPDPRASAASWCPATAPG